MDIIERREQRKPSSRLMPCDVIIQDERVDYQVVDLDVMVDGVFIEYQCYQGP